MKRCRFVSRWCTDPGTRIDIPAWCRMNGYQVLDIAQRGAEAGADEGRRGRGAWKAL